MKCVHWKTSLEQFEGEYDKERIAEAEEWIDTQFCLDRLTPQEAADGYFSFMWVARRLNFPKIAEHLWDKVQNVFPGYDPLSSPNPHVKAMWLDMTIRVLKEGVARIRMD